MTRKLAKFDFKDSADLFDSSQTLLIYDEYLESLGGSVRKWLRSFPVRYPVKSGEELKALRNFPRHFEALAKRTFRLPPRSLTVVACGGGSVGDFAGFFASVYKRGVRLVHVPSTWLAAIDSSHGGKTALNNGAIKNQLGTFYPADKVLLSRELLSGQPPERIVDAMGELGKIAIIDGSDWVSRMEQSQLRGEDLLWKFLMFAIEAKLEVVDRDPLEKTGVRQILNLGHTVGHVFEAQFGWSHGVSVSQGLFFAIDWAFNRDDMTTATRTRVLKLLTETLGIERVKPVRLRAADFVRLLRADKKLGASDAVTFLFPVRMGRVVRVSVKLNDVLIEARRQGWVR